MKRLITLCILQCIVITHAYAVVEKEIVIITASYNNKDWYEGSLDSVRTQKYSKWRMIYTNDASTDGTGELVAQYIDKHNLHDRITLINNTHNRGAMANQYNAIHSCKGTNIIIILDGDDRLAHENVLSYINNVYADPNIWLTYGQFVEYPYGSIGFCCQMPDHVIKTNAFRSFGHIPSHMRTFYAQLFHHIKKEDLMYNGAFLVMDADIAAMFPMIEMARYHFKFIPDVIYIYNGANSLNDHKKSVSLQRSLDVMIRAKKRYDALETLF